MRNINRGSDDSPLLQLTRSEKIRLLLTGSVKNANDMNRSSTHERSKLMAAVNSREQQVQLQDLNSLQMKVLPPQELQKMKEKKVKPIHPLALRLAAELFKNPETGGRIELATPAQQQARDQIKALLSNGLKQAARREKKNMKVRCISNPNELIFYYEPAKPKEKKGAEK